MNTIEDARAVQTAGKIDYYEKCNGDIGELGHSLRLRLEVLKEMLKDKKYRDDPDYLDSIITDEVGCILASSVKFYCNR